MTFLDIITPIPKTLIPDDERRRGVNGGFLITVALILLFLFIYWLFKDLAGVTDAAEHPFLLVLLELAKVLAGFIMYLVACWGFKVCVHVFTLKSEKPAPAASPEAPVEVPPEIDLSQPDPIAVRDLFTEGTKPYVISNLYDWIALEGNRRRTDAAPQVVDYHLQGNAQGRYKSESSGQSHQCDKVPL